MAHSHAQLECLWQLLFVVKNFYDFLISKKSLVIKPYLQFITDFSAWFTAEEAGQYNNT